MPAQRAIEELRGAAVYLGAAILLCDGAGTSAPLEDLGARTRVALRSIALASHHEKPSIRRIQLLHALREVAGVIVAIEDEAAEISRIVG